LAFFHFMTILILAFLLLIQPAFADPINSAHQTCAKDDDCALISLICCPCGNAQDTGVVNKLYAKQDEHQCTKDEIQSCAENGACAQVAKPVAVCINQRCVIKMQQVTH